MKLKILQINKFYYLRGGSESYLLKLSKLLEQAGHQVIPFAMSDGRNWSSNYREYFSEAMDLRKFSLKNIFKIYYNWDAARRLERLILKAKPDAAHLHVINYQLSPSVITVLKRHKIPAVMTIHDFSLICPNKKLFSRGQVCDLCRGARYYHCLLRRCAHGSYGLSFLAMLEAYINLRWRKAYEQVDLFIAPSQYVKDIHIKFGWPGDKIKVMPNFIETDVEEPAAPEAADYILYFGRLAPEKGITVLLKALSQANSRVKLKIAGAGPDYKMLRNRISELSLTGRVELLGFKYGEDLKALIKGALAVVVPSVCPEVFGYTALEALALGKIVIASRVGGLSEIIRDGDNGFLFASGDSHELARKINLAAARNEPIKIMEDRAKNSLAKFNPQDHYEKIMELYKKILEHKNSLKS